MRGQRQGHPFPDRVAAGRELGARLAERGLRDPVVLGIPRGGVPVAAEVARMLDAPLDVLLSRKIGAPWNPELAMGAVAEGGVRVLEPDVVAALGVDHDLLAELTARARQELERRLALYRRGRGAVPVAGREVVVVDDGLATGATAAAAVRALRHRGPARIVLAVPVASGEALRLLAAEADEVVCLTSPDPFHAVGSWYERFGQVGDDEVAALLAGTGARPARAPRSATAVEREVVLHAGGVAVRGDLRVPAGAAGIVLFAHGSGSSRLSPRNRHVAGVLNTAGFATLLLDLLTPDEERDRGNVFDVSLLAGRLRAATAWVRAQPGLAPLPIGYVGASTGAAAALAAAAEGAGTIRAVVSRGGRPDLAGPYLERVEAPVLLIVGGHDTVVLDLNRRALERLPASARLVVVPGATHLFEEPGALDAAADAAARWFAAHLAGRGG